MDRNEAKRCVAYEPFNLAKYLNPTEFKREVLMSMSDGVYELFPTRTTDEQPNDVKVAVMNRNGY